MLILVKIRSNSAWKLCLQLWFRWLPFLNSSKCKRCCEFIVITFFIICLYTWNRKNWICNTRLCKGSYTLLCSLWQSAVNTIRKTYSQSWAYTWASVHKINQEVADDHRRLARGYSKLDTSRGGGLEYVCWFWTLFPQLSSAASSSIDSSCVEKLILSGGCTCFENGVEKKTSCACITKLRLRD